jgi:hypothetical protein
MMLLSPTLTLSRLLVKRGGKSVFDQAFKLGLNVLSGENGSGKTTVADFIFFALGGEPRSWREAALKCDYVYAEVRLNGNTATLRREVTNERQRPLAIKWNSLESALTTGDEGWELYPYAAKGEKSSFSQVLFTALGIPEVHPDKTSRITIHQLLRLLYVDQTTAFDELFVHEQFDSYQTREAVGELLFGVYDQTVYLNRLRMRDLDSRKKASDSELSAIFRILGDEKLVPEFVEQEAANLRDRRDGVYRRLEIIKKQPGRVSTIGEQAAGSLKTLLADLEHVRSAVLEGEQRIRQLKVDLADSDAFIEALRERIRALDEARDARDLLGQVEFKFCPACYAKLTRDEKTLCHLCGTTRTEKAVDDNWLRMRRELAQQEEESVGRAKTLREELDGILAGIESQRDSERALTLRLNELSSTVRTDTSTAEVEAFREIGRLDQEIEQANQRLKLAERVSKLRADSASISKEMALLSTETAALEAAQSSRRYEVSKKICDLTASILERDLPRDLPGVGADVTFDLASNTVKVDGRNNYAASSMVYLKNAFHLALLLASTQLQYMRLPRFMLLDNVEDKGMEPERSHNFQQIVAEESAALEVEHQLILLTSMLSPALANSDVVIRAPFAEGARSLALS